MKLQQGCENRPEFGYYRCDKPLYRTLAQDNVAGAAEGVILGDNATGISFRSRVANQITCEQIEWDYTRMWAGVVSNADAVKIVEKGYDGYGWCVLLSSELLDTKFKYFPLVLSQKGITLRLDMNNSAYLCRSSKAFMGTTYADNAALYAINGTPDPISPPAADIHVWYSNTILWYESIIIPDSFKM